MTAVVQGTIVIPRNKASPKMKKAYTYIRKGFGGAPIVTYSYTEDKNYCYFNRNIAKFRKYNEDKFEYNLVDGEDIKGNMVNGFALYPHQQVVEDVVLAHLTKDINCLVQAPVRFGKTILLTSLLTKIKKKTLILVDKTLLVEQMFNDIKEYSNLNVGLLSKDGSKFDITITTFQFLNANPKLLESIRNDFGVLAVDELHVSAASTYTAIINSFPVRVRLGMTATPTRSSDKLTEVLTDLFGNVAVIGENPNALAATTEYIRLPKAYFPAPYNPKASLSKYLTSPEVASVVYNIIAKHVGKTIMVVSDIKKVQTFYSPYALNSDMKKAERTEVMAKINSGDIKLFSGYGVLLKGITLPKLEIIIHLMAATTQENLQQLRGRLLTPPNKGESKSPIFIELQTKNMSWKEEQRERWLATLDKS